MSPHPGRFLALGLAAAVIVVVTLGLLEVFG